MAHIVERQRKDGSTTFQVRWRAGGTRTARQDNEKFDNRPAAEQFKKLVDAHNQQWPHGWIPGQGFTTNEPRQGDVPFTDWALRCIDRLTAIDELTREDYRREVRLHLSLLRHCLPTGETTPATIGNLTAEDIQDWIREEERGLQDPKHPDKWLRKPAHPTSITRRHGLLYSFVQAAIDADPPLRTKNCCASTKLPRTDTRLVEPATYLERDEYARIAQEIKDPYARDLADWLVGTGMRWGEATALQARDLSLSTAVPAVTIQRSWKRAATGSGRSQFLGPPKTKKARRTIGLPPHLADMARRLATGLPPEALLFRTNLGKPWLHPNFYQRVWKPAVDTAVERGLAKRPRIHDLRHTHVAWLVHGRIPLPAIQARLGHESITTTIDQYGHLVREFDEEISDVLEAAMTATIPADTGLRLVPAVGD
ncbi:tyrosine-type recombinase/integrase [Streptomyces sp. NPDC004111]|uniref:tyrosine-type recombinase/integrase n=1 Tax=Streptomyces sp. NPDC004111 TaxID=3364690 RepID=UPI0036817728